MAVKLDDLPPSIRKKIDEKLGKKKTTESKRKELTENLVAIGLITKTNKKKKEEIILRKPTPLKMSTIKGSQWITIFKYNYEKSCRVYSNEMESQIRGALEEIGEDILIEDTDSEGVRTVMTLTIGNDDTVRIIGGYTPLCEDCGNSEKQFSSLSIENQEKIFEKVKLEISNL